MDQKKETADAGYKNCFVEEHADFYRLLAYLHNFTLKTANSHPQNQ